MLRDLLRPGFTIVEQEAGTAVSTTPAVSTVIGSATPEIVWIDTVSVASAATDLMRADGNAQVLLLHIPRDLEVYPPENRKETERETKWVFATSGTTGKPKLVAHALGSLTRTTSRAERPQDRWGLLYPWYRFAGLQVLLQAGLAGSVLIAPDLALPLAGVASST